MPVSWLNLSFLLIVHVGGLAAIAVYAAVHGVTPSAVIIGAILTTVTIWSISVGYHRLFAHRAFEAHPALRLFLLAFGAASFQTSAREWASKHRRHHSRVDSDLDPYDARRGFWYSHVGWVLRKDNPAIPMTPVRDLDADPLVRWQERYSFLIGGLVGFALPLLLGFACGDPWGGLIFGGFGRLIVVYQATFSINSLAHMLGSQPYSDRDSSRDSFVTALVSMGEGYHNFHHTFPRDYRNGVLPHQFDPSKWSVRVMAALGITRNLKRTPAPVILRARLHMEARRIERRRLHPVAYQRLEDARAAFDAALSRWSELLHRYETASTAVGIRWAGNARTLRDDLRGVKREVRTAMSEWRRLLRSPEFAFAT